MSSQPSGRIQRALRAAMAPSMCALLVAILGAAFLVRTDFHNPLDEYTHYDYVVRLARDGQIPRMNDTVGQEALREWACTGQMSAALVCGADEYDASQAPWSGISSATAYPLLFYAITAGITRVVHTFAWNLSWMDAARVASLSWLVALTALAVALGRRLGGPGPAAMAGAILLGSMPLVLSQGASVNNDVPAVFMTFLTVWAWLTLTGRSSAVRWGTALVLATAALLIKPHAVLALMVVTALELVRRLAEAPRRGRRSREVLVVLGGAAGSIVAFALITRVIEPLLRGAPSAVPGMAEFLASVEPQDFGMAAAKSYAGILGVFQAAAFVPAFTGAWAQLLPTFVAAAALGGLVFAVLRSESPLRESPVGVVRQVTALYVVAFPVVFMGYLKMLGSPYFSNPRYHLIGMALALVLLLVGSRRGWGWAALAASVGVWGFLLHEVLTWTG